MSLVTTTALHYESTCTGVDAGELEMRLNGNGAEGVLVRWLDCTNVAFEFLGSGVL